MTTVPSGLNGICLSETQVFTALRRGIGLNLNRQTVLRLAFVDELIFESGRSIGVPGGEHIVNRRAANLDRAARSFFGDE